MPIDDSMRDSVVLIIGDRQDEMGNTYRGPIGTGFIVTVPSEADRDYEYGYVVTAWHVISNQNNISMLARASGVLQTITLNHWIPHEGGEDLAAGPFVIQEDERVFSRLELHLHSSDAAMVAPRLGARLYFIGLLEPAAEMSGDGVPMVRSGTVGARDQPLEWPEGHATTCHLVDVRSYGGFSGSPVYIEASHPGPAAAELSPLAFTDLDQAARRGLGALHHQIWLWGVLVAHFDQIERAEGKPVTRVNVGVGIVLPVARVKELLYQDEFVEMRKESDEER